MKRYVMLGGGGTGSQFIGPTLAYLAAIHKGEEWQYLVVDGDHFTESNMARQLFAPKFIGVNKAEALAETFPQYPVEAIDKYVGKDELETIITEGAITFICVDNYSVRALVEERVLQLKDAVVINAGNEKTDGSVQIWVRENGKNKTPRISYGHPEIKYISKDDRSAMTCAQAMELPGGEQLIIANMAAANHMLHALYRWHKNDWKSGWTEMNFDLATNEINYINARERRNWANDRAKVILDGA